MKIKKVGKLLKKLNNLYDNIKDDNQISSIEKDLFLSYVKELYEHAMSADHDASPIAAAPSQPAPSTHTTEDSQEEAIETRQVLDEVAETTTATATHVEPTAVVQEIVPETPAPIVETVEETVESSVSATSKPEVVREEPKVVEPTTSVNHSSLSDEMTALFTVDGIKEVSDRLRMQPISDMNRCMGINERIFTIRELFGNDDAVFNKTMDHLNTLSNFDSARDYLSSGVAVDYAWDDENRIKKAGNFVKLVYRRYL